MPRSSIPGQKQRKVPWVDLPKEIYEADSLVCVLALGEEVSDLVPRQLKSRGKNEGPLRALPLRYRSCLVWRLKRTTSAPLHGDGSHLVYREEGLVCGKVRQGLPNRLKLGPVLRIFAR